MGYYIRVLGSQDPNIHIDELIEALNQDGLTAKFEFDLNEQPGNWTKLLIFSNNGENLAHLERNPIVNGELGQEELNEFREIIQDYKPTSSVHWLTIFLTQ